MNYKVGDRGKLLSTMPPKAAKKTQCTARTGLVDKVGAGTVDKVAENESEISTNASDTDALEGTVNSNTAALCFFGGTGGT